MQQIAQNVSKYEMRSYVWLNNSDIETDVVLNVRLVTSYVKKREKNQERFDLCNFDAALTTFIHLDLCALREPYMEKKWQQYVRSVSSSEF